MTVEHGSQRVGRLDRDEVPRRSLRRDESGIAIIIVVSVIAMLTIIVTEFTYSVTLDQFRVRNSLNSLQSELMVRSGVNLAEGFLALDTDKGVDAFSEEWYFTMTQFCQQLELPNGALVRCDVKDESGKINVNLTQPTGPPRTTVDDEPTPDAILRGALQCIFQNREGLDPNELIVALKEYWDLELPPFDDGTPQPASRKWFLSVEDFASKLNIPTRDIAYLRKYISAYPPRRLRRININTATQEVLSVVISPDPGAPGGCGPVAEVEEILTRQLDPENPIRQAEVQGLLSSVTHGAVIASVFGTNSSLYRIEASAITNPNPDNPTHGGVGKTLSVVIYRECAEETPEGCLLWTSKPLDWQKEGGARLFREPNRFSGLSEYYGEFDPAAAGELFQ